jgi:hypothetical protein
MHKKLLEKRLLKYVRNIRKDGDVKSWDNSVGVAIGYGLDGRDSIIGGGNVSFSSPQRPVRFWGPLNFLYNGCRKLFPRR